MVQFAVNTFRFDPYKNFKFRVKWDGKYVAGVSKISPLKKTGDVVTHREGGDPSHARLSPSTWKFDPITFERGVTHDSEFEAWANLVNNMQGDPAMSLKNFRKDLIIELLDEQGNVAKAYNVYRCWVSEYTALPELDGNAHVVAIEKLVAQNEGWERDLAVGEPTENLMNRARDPLGVVRKVPLGPATGRWALLREPSGFDEESVGGRGTMDAVRLLDGLLVAAPGAAVAPGNAARLSVPERDFLLAAAYRMVWGPKIEGTLRCAGCGELFDFAFSLDDLVEAVHAALSELPVEQGVYALPNGCRFRLPTAEDEESIAGLAEEEAEDALLERCVVAGDAIAGREEILAALERVGAGIDTDLTAVCVACGHAHVLSFQMQDYLLGAISSDWVNLVECVHRLALSYRWGLHEVLSLPSSRRRAFVALLDGDAIARPVGLT